MVKLVKKEVDAILAKNDELLNTFEKKVVKGFANDKISHINYAVLKRLVELKKYPVNGGIYFMPIDLRDEVLRFRTVMDNRFYKWSFGNQDHDCWEECEVIEGVLIHHSKEYHKGEKLILKPFELHNPTAKEGVITQLWVRFSMYPFKN